ncbi:MAG: hypothetical protein DRN61_04665, partial [Thaumarchaeota archaeon]
AGRLKMLGATVSHWRGTTRGVRYVHRSMFEALSPWSEEELVELSKLRGGYTLFSDPGVVDYLSLPALKVEVDSVELVLAFVDPSATQLQVDKLSLSVSLEGEGAEAEVKLRPGVIEGSAKRRVSRAGRARLALLGELEASIEGLKASTEVSVKLAEAIDACTGFRYELPSAEPTLLITEESVAPSHVMKSLALTGPTISWMSEGKYRLPLTLDLPSKPGVKHEVELPQPSPCRMA